MQTRYLNYAERTQDDLKFSYWIAYQFFKIEFNHWPLNHSVTSTKQRVFLKGHHSPLMRIQAYFYPNRPLEEIEYSYRGTVGFVQAHRWTLDRSMMTPTSKCSTFLVLLSQLPFTPIFPTLIVFLSLSALFSIFYPLLPFSLGSLWDILPFCYPFLFECLLFV